MSENTLPQQIAVRLRRDILRGALQPGAPIKERDKAAEFGVSRTPLREAIRILAKEELVVLRPARSPLVANPSLKEISDTIDVLRVLETFSGELACRHATQADLAEISALNERMGALYDTIDPFDLFEIDMEFHRVMVRAAHNAALAETHRSYLARLWRVGYLSAIQGPARERMLRQHDAMVEGLMARDAERVRSAIDAHLEHLLAHVTRLFQKADGTDADPAKAET